MIVESLSETVVLEHLGRPVTHRELSDLFSRVCSENWKDPIDKTLVLNREDSMLMSGAVEFFTGGPARITLLSPRDSKLMPVYRVTADGYYACIGA
jgi:hypothetical protein